MITKRNMSWEVNDEIFGKLDLSENSKRLI